MKKIAINSRFSLLFVITGCVMAETISEPTTIYLQIDQEEFADISVYFQFPDKKIKSNSVNGIFTINVPQMRGGYSDFMGMQFNVHDPYSYKNILLFEGDQLLAELSINDIHKLQKNRIDTLNVYTFVRQ